MVLVSIVTRLHAGQPRNQGLILRRFKGFFLLQSMKIVSDAHPASSVVGMSVTSPWVKHPGYKADHVPAYGT